MTGDSRNPHASEERRLAAIVFTDVASYSARMQQDETGTLARVRADFDKMRALAALHNGEVLKSTGDGLLLCFASVVQAVECALRIQGEFAGREPEELHHRIGIHLGDVFRKDGDIAGDGVNIAARLESKAQPGTICVSQSVYEAVKGKLPMQVRPLGPQQFKNIADPIPVFLLAPARAGRLTTSPAGGKPARYAALLAALLLAGLGLWLWPRGAPAPAPAGLPATPPAPAVRADRSIAVLPFANRSNREEDAFFTDGVHDDLLTQISRIRSLRTISRTSVMAYRNTQKNMRTIGEELGVTAILEGGVQRAGNHVRINVQLIDTATDTHLWAEIYDRELTAENVFKIQTEIAGAIAAALRTVLTPDEQRQLARLPTQNLAALEAYFKAGASDMAGSTEGIRRDIEHLQRAIELDPGFAQAHARLAGRYLSQIYFDGADVETQLAKVEPLLTRALELDPQSSEAYVTLGDMKVYQNAIVEAEAAFRHAIALNPNNVQAYVNLSLFLNWKRVRPAEALELNARAMELEPARKSSLRQQRAEFLAAAGKQGEAQALLKSVLRDDPRNSQAYRSLAGLLWHFYSRFDQALILMRQGYVLDPNSAVFPTQLALMYNDAGDQERAAEWAGRVLQSAGRGGVMAPLLRALVHRARGESDLELAAHRQANPSHANFVSSLRRLRDHDLQAGRAGEAWARYAQAFPDLAESTDPEVDGGNYYLAKDMAAVLLALGRKPEAERLLQRALVAATSGADLQAVAQIEALRGERRLALAALRELAERGGYDVHLEKCIEFDALRSDPEFQAVMSKINALLAEQRRRLRELESSGELAPLPPVN